jgi:hypothetical protein
VISFSLCTKITEQIVRVFKNIKQVMKISNNYNELRIESANE